ncbi:Protein of unknown function [Actinoplanes philippinensis]|uniref:DUF3152 domain-containing protein n=2 Tax=Actinoplanes philippinensis TaxID=35752 RepID=A0A1I2ITJ7_9ACTN|nr:Protein of unknown function [Actinoplanes philippinensis]
MTGFVRVWTPMTKPPSPTPEPFSPSRGDRWRQAWLLLLAAALVLLTVVAVSRPSDTPAGPPGHPAAAASPVSPSAGPSSLPAPSPSPSAVPTDTVKASVFPPAGLLKLDGAVPVKGTGRFEYANERGPVAGTGGRIRRFKVAVEKGSGEDVAGFAAQVRAVLEDERSWIGTGTVRMQMVGGADQADFTVYLATRDTAGRMCEVGGTSIRIGGVPYTSCRAVGKAIINLDRWRTSAPPYLEAKADLAAYRQYVINHEVGHELGHRHEGCPKAGGPAPVMVQQTLTLRGCVPWSWPRDKGRDLAGPRL